jgi:hypothetical protein
LLGKGELKGKLNFEVAGASKSAIAAVEKAGGSVKTTFVKTVHMDKKGKPGKRPPAPPEGRREAHRRLSSCSRAPEKARVRTPYGESPRFRQRPV